MSFTQTGRSSPSTSTLSTSSSLSRDSDLFSSVLQRRVHRVQTEVQEWVDKGKRRHPPPPPGAGINDDRAWYPNASVHMHNEAYKLRMYSGDRGRELLKRLRGKEGKKGMDRRER